MIEDGEPSSSIHHNTTADYPPIADETTVPGSGTADRTDGHRASGALLNVENLHTRFDTQDGVVHAVDGVSFDLKEGEIVGLVGESGCGKSVTALSLMGLESPGRIVEGSIRFRGEELTIASDRRLRRLRGSGLSMVFQDPKSSLNPVFPVGEQVAESVRAHRRDDWGLLDEIGTLLTEDGAHDRTIELMTEVGIPAPTERVGDYPHEFSGGMCQRAMLAVALAGDPDILIADEPTTALDVTTQASVLDTIERLCDERGMATLLITHDLGVVAEHCDRVVVMYGGQVMEHGPVERVLTAPRHPYTQALLGCLPQSVPRGHRLPAIEGRVPDLLGGTTGCPYAPRCEYVTDGCTTGDVPTVELPAGTVRCGELDRVPDGLPRPIDRATRTRSTSTGSPIVELRDVSKAFPVNDSLLKRLSGRGDSRAITAVDDVSLTLATGETLGLVGESGCGKTTLADLVTGLRTPTSGTVLFDGQPVGVVEERPSAVLTNIGVVFQHPRTSLNPRQRVRQIISEPLREDGRTPTEREARVGDLIDLVGLPQRHADSYPHQLSGGQLQRVAIARAVALDPRLVVLDEPTSALDVSVQARILNLLSDLQDRLGLTYLFISHDLSVVEHVADRIAVMYLGEIMESGPTERVFDRPSHPYTGALLDAIPAVDPTAERDRVRLSRDLPDPANKPNGCPFHTRCPIKRPECAKTDPEFERVDRQRSRCLLAREFVAGTTDTTSDQQLAQED